MKEILRAPFIALYFCLGLLIGEFPEHIKAAMGSIEYANRAICGALIMVALISGFRGIRSFTRLHNGFWSLAICFGTVCAAWVAIQLLPSAFSVFRPHESVDELVLASQKRWLCTVVIWVNMILLGEWVSPNR